MTDSKTPVKAGENPDLLEAEAYELLAKAKRIRAAQAAPVVDELLDAAMVEAQFHVHMRVLSDAARRGELVVEHVGRKPVVRRTVLEAWIASRRTTPRHQSAADVGGLSPIELAAKRLRRTG